jgi:hypothetical protein
MKDPHWIIIAIASALAGWSLPYIGKIAYFLIRRFKKDHLEGEWFAYHWTYKKGKPVLSTSQWRIRKGVLHRFRVEYAHQDGMAYRGYAKIERSQLIVKIHSTCNQETAQFRLTWPISSNANLLWGVWLSFDHDTKIASGAQLLSRIKLSKKDAIEAINGAMRWEDDRPVIRVEE